MHLRVWAALSLALVLLIGCGGGQTNLQEPNVDRTVTDDTALPQPTMSAAAAQAAATTVRDLARVGDTLYVLTDTGLVIESTAPAAPAPAPTEATPSGTDTQTTPEPVPATAAAPTRTAQTVQIGEGARRLLVNGARAYLVAGTNGLRIVDLTPVGQAALAGTYAPESGQVELAAVEGGLALVGLGRAGLAVVDVATPRSPTEAKLLPDLRNITDLAIGGRWGYVLGEELTVLDLSQPAEARVATIFDLEDRGQALALDGDRLLVVGATSYQLLDVSRPEEPRRVARQTTDEAAAAVAPPTGQEIARGDSATRAQLAGNLGAVLRDGRVILFEAADALRATLSMDALGAATGVLLTAGAPQLLTATGELVDIALADGHATEVARRGLLGAATGAATVADPPPGATGLAPTMDTAPALTTTPETAPVGQPSEGPVAPQLPAAEPTPSD
ncbi:MAG TPA: hypothetical protein DCZ72_10940 [Armatimonadetes bacterium]|nr:hypothetical protein [Armatimonadota bacterium]